MKVLGVGLFWILGAIVLLIEGFAAVRLSQRSEPRPPHLQFSIPEARKDEAVRLQILPSQVGDLAYDRGHHYRLRPSSATAMELLYLEFDSGKSSLRFDLFGHPPEACLRNAGGIVDEVYPEEMWETGEEAFLVRSVKARDLSGESFVFKAMWFPGIEKFDAGSQDLAWDGSRMMRAFLSEPPPGILFLVIVRGLDDREEAKQLALSHGFSLISNRES